MNKFLGAHVSASGGAENAPLNAKEIGAIPIQTHWRNQWPPSWMRCNVANSWDWTGSTSIPVDMLDKMGESECLTQIAQSINTTLDQTSGVIAVIENTAGQGSHLGHTFDHIPLVLETPDDSKWAEEIKLLNSFT